MDKDIIGQLKNLEMLLSKNSASFELIRNTAAVIFEDILPSKAARKEFKESLYLCTTSEQIKDTCNKAATKWLKKKETK